MLIFALRAAGFYIRIIMEIPILIIALLVLIVIAVDKWVSVD